jgi:hypothetical protein
MGVASMTYQGATEHFFSCCNPQTASDIIVSLAAGTPIKVARLPLDALPAVALLALIGLRRYNQQIVDDYLQLFVNLQEAIHDASILNDKFCHPELYLACFMADRGPACDCFLEGVYDAEYMFPLYTYLVNQDVTRLFEEVV